MKARRARDYARPIGSPNPQTNEPPPPRCLMTMKPHPLLPLLLLAAMLTATRLHAETAATPTWHPQTLPQAIINMLIFAVIGIVVAIAGFKLFDKCTPGDLAKEIIENKNVAAAILGGAVILGVCLIVAAAMMG